jgi:hypothetical protein
VAGALPKCRIVAGSKRDRGPITPSAGNWYAGASGLAWLGIHVAPMIHPSGGGLVIGGRF